MPKMTSPETDDVDHALPYRLVGRFLEACDCFAICPCWIDEQPDEEQCTGVYVWDINDGEADGRDVSGLRVASVSFHEGKRRGSRQKVAVFIDDRADDHDYDALVAVFTGRRGGPLAELSDMMGELLFTRSAAIDVVFEDDERATVNIAGAVRIASDPKFGPSGRVTTLVDSAMAEMFGSPGLVAISSEFRVDLGKGLEIEVSGRSATTGWFSYTG